VAAYSLPDYKLVKIVTVGSHPEWMTIPPDGKNLYVGCAGTDSTDVVDLAAMRMIQRIPVGSVPKRNTSGLIETE
jgi:YVTN family beta-propeller protein